MSLEELEKRLFAAARALPPNTHVPYAFEKRVMASLAHEPVPDGWAIWSRLLWRAAAPCVGVMLVMTVWSAVSSQMSGPANLAADLESVVWEPLTSLHESW